MTTLVTGALGAIGSAVVHRLVAEGEPTVAFDLRADTELIDGIINEVRVETGDIRDWRRIGALLRDYEVSKIIHLAALLPDHAQRDPALAVEVNVGGTLNVCELAGIFGIQRVVFASSKGVYRRVDGEEGHPSYKPLDEDYPIGPDGVYDVTKYAAEQLGLNYHTSRGLDFVALRFAATYGPGRTSRHGALAIRSSIVENAFHKVPTVVPRGGEQGDDFVYTKDVAQGIVKAASANPEHRIFNIGSGQRSTLADAADIIRRRYPSADIQVGPGTDYGASGRYCVFDISRAISELGYKPQFDHSSGIGDYLDTLEHRSALES